MMKSHNFFRKMVDELVEFSAHDPELADGIKGAELIIFPGGSHLFGVQDPPTFNRATLDWLAKVS